MIRSACAPSSASPRHFEWRTLGTISATNQEKLRDGFAPLLPGFTVVEFDNLEAVRAAMNDHTAGFLVEPIQGEGGVRQASAEFMQGLRALAEAHIAEFVETLSQAARAYEEPTAA